jgi:hypothetical protein
VTLLIEQVRQRSVLDEIRARFPRIDLAEIQLVACRDAADLRFAPAQGDKPRISIRYIGNRQSKVNGAAFRSKCTSLLRDNKHEFRLDAGEQVQIPITTQKRHATKSSVRCYQTVIRERGVTPAAVEKYEIPTRIQMNIETTYA